MTPKIEIYSYEGTTPDDAMRLGESILEAIKKHGFTYLWGDMDYGTIIVENRDGRLVQFNQIADEEES